MNTAYNWFKDNCYYTRKPESSKYHYNNDALMTKYWAAKEMAKQLVHDTFKWRIDDEIIIANFKDSKNYLTQLLKKEWFR